MPYRWSSIINANRFVKDFQRLLERKAEGKINRTFNKILKEGAAGGQKCQWKVAIPWHPRANSGSTNDEGASRTMGAMPEDVFDIVDEQDQVVGNQLRSIIHAEHLRHRAVHILLRNAGGKVFLQKRSPKKDKNPDRWDSSCSGHVDAGEDYDQAAVRELQEELGIVVSIQQLQRVCKFDARRETGMEFVWVYFGQHDGPFSLNPEEISDGRYWEIDEVDEAIVTRKDEFSGAFRYIWTQIRGTL